MDLDSFFDDLRRRVLGRPVTFRRLAANTLLIYIDNEPGDGTGVTFWINPVWHVREPGQVLAGSRQAQVDDEEEFYRLGERLDVLLGLTVQDVTIEPGTFDLTLALSGGYLVKTFVAQAARDESWHIRDNTTGSRLSGSPQGLRIVSHG
ncbi:MAG TPA: hypothetical protein VF789_08430 [Thermoanaerobaculia bacterium]